MAPVPEEHADKLASPATEASAARENSLRVTTAQCLVIDDQQRSSSRTSRQGCSVRQKVGSLRNDFRDGPFSVEHSLSIEPDNKKRSGYKK
jgi:hypothetical protein